mgnify:CR=1 FL=1
MKIVHYSILLIITLFFSCKNKMEIDENINSPYSSYLIKHFSKKSKNVRWLLKEKDSVSNSLLFKHGNYIISVSNDPLIKKTKNVILKNPYYKEVEKDAYNSNNYPISYSVVYNNKLISLFKGGKFVCHDLLDFERDLEFENKINTYDFQNFWLYNKKLIALYNNEIYIWEDSVWKKSDIDFPLNNSKKLYEDESFVVFKDDFGEWGGTLYFFEKKTGIIYYTLSFGAKNVYKANNKFYVTERINEGNKITEIENPRNLSVANRNKMFQKVKLKFKDGNENIGAYGYLDNSKITKEYSFFDSLNLISSFCLNEKRYFLVNVYGLTFVAELKEKGKRIEIVHPFFKNSYFSNNPTTHVQEDYIIINLDHNYSDYLREASVVLINKNEILKLDWNILHN